MAAEAKEKGIELAPPEPAYVPPPKTSAVQRKAAAAISKGTHIDFFPQYHRCSYAILGTVM